MHFIKCFSELKMMWRKKNKKQESILTYNRDKRIEENLASLWNQICREKWINEQFLCHRLRLFHCNHRKFSLKQKNKIKKFKKTNWIRIAKQDRLTYRSLLSHCGLSDSFAEWFVTSDLLDAILTEVELGKRIFEFEKSFVTLDFVDLVSRLTSRLILLNFYYIYLN